jgi:hypothetical protein
VPHGHRDGSLRPYSRLSQPDNRRTDAYNSQELQNVFSSPRMITIITWRIWVGHVARVNPKRSSYTSTALLGRSEGCALRWFGLDSSGSGYGPAEDILEHGTEPSSYTT